MPFYQTIPFNTHSYPFVEVVKKVFEVDSLEGITETHDELFKVSADSQTTYHDKFYNAYRAGWLEMEDLYLKFITEIIAPMFDEDFLYQKFPTSRVHLKKNIAVGAFHKDSDFGHPAGEINFIIPLTDSDNTASIWVESEPDRGDFTPMVLREGELIKFNGNILTHGNKVNEENSTRVSMDFRVLPISKYDETNSGISITKGTKFTIGQYYKLFTKK